jgi:hypothetical protein
MKDPDVEASIGKLKAYVDSTYYPIPKDEHERLLDSLAALTQMGQNKKESLRSVLEHVSRLIFKFFGFQEIGIGLKSAKDQLFRYEVLFGYRKDLVDLLAKIEYSHEDMIDNDRFPSMKMGKSSELIFAEKLSESDRIYFARPYQLDAKRQEVDDFREGDYIDVYMYGPNRELVGWIELSSPMDRKLPSRTAIKWIELIASICGWIVVEKQKQEGFARA